MCDYERQRQYLFTLSRDAATGKAVVDTFIENICYGKDYSNIDKDSHKNYTEMYDKKTADALFKDEIQMNASIAGMKMRLRFQTGNAIVPKILAVVYTGELTYDTFSTYIGVLQEKELQDFIKKSFSGI